MNNFFDIAVIGAGHAGLEAAWLSAQFNLRILLVSLPDVDIGNMPCNPSIGGVGKGQLVREIGVMGGIMPILADKNAIQARILNESKGYAVRSTRFQIDKEKYARDARKMINENCNITLLREKVNAVSFKDESFEIVTEQGQYLLCKKLIVTAGTFLGGKLHIGTEISFGGNYGVSASHSLEKIFGKSGPLLGRFKTGTPARIFKDSIDYTSMDAQESDPRSRNFSYLNPPSMRYLPQVNCYLARTNSNTLSIIRNSKDRSPLFNGQIAGVGPRYCPSIEDKAYRYPDRDIHHVFLEPEGLDLDTYYPNGLSTSLPKDVQLAFLRSIRGLEKAEIRHYGYAVEYDVVDSSKLNHTLECKEFNGLYFAGQVNGTSGYEEAAAQGVVAGINAACSLLGMPEIIFNRDESYIGVLIDDLVSSKRDEPYRLFTARSENRLYIREDNTIDRIYHLRKLIGAKSELDFFCEKYLEEVNILESLCSGLKLDQVLKAPQNDPVLELKKVLLDKKVEFLEDSINAVAIKIKYSGYIDQVKNELEKFKKLYRKHISWQDLSVSQNISFECRQRIIRYRPRTFLELKEIEGIRPATLAYVAGNCL